MSFNLPTTTVEEIGSNVSQLIGDFSIVITLILGILVAFFIIEFIIDTIRGERS